MAHTSKAAFACIWILASVGVLHGGDEKINGLLKEQLESAQKAYQASWTAYKTNILPRVSTESLCQWSKRLMEVEQSLAKKKAEKISALEKHIARIKALEEIQAARGKVDFGERRQLAAVTFFRLEAEILLTKAKDGSPPKKR
jgi:hypothetical protein